MLKPNRSVVEQLIHKVKQFKHNYINVRLTICVFEADCLVQLYRNTFIFSKHIILVRIVVDLDLKKTTGYEAEIHPGWYAGYHTNPHTHLYLKAI